MTMNRPLKPQIKKLMCFSLSLPSKMTPSVIEPIKLKKLNTDKKHSFQGKWLLNKALSANIDTQNTSHKTAKNQMDYTMKKMAFIINQLMFIEQPATILIATFVFAERFNIAQEESILFLIVKRFNDLLNHNNTLIQDNKHLHINLLDSAESLWIDNSLFIGVTLKLNIKLNIILRMDKHKRLVIQLDVFNTQSRETTTFYQIYERI